MAGSQRNATKSEVYERLIDRLGMALDAARTAGRLRDERPAELELRGLSTAEIELINAYLDRNGREARDRSSITLSEATESSSGARIIWLKDKLAGPQLAKAGSRGFK